MSAMSGATDDKEPPLGVLQRALSRRHTGVMDLNTDLNAPKSTEFDNKRVLPHMRESSMQEDVAASSPRALASALQLSRNHDSSEAEAFDDKVKLTDHKLAAAAKEVNAEVVSGGGDDDDDDDDDAPPVQRGMPHFRDATRDCGSQQAEGQARDGGLPRWDPNMQLTLEEFHPDMIDYLAEGSMCQCFLARAPPDSMHLLEDIRAAAKMYGVVIKAPIKGGPAVSENDLVVESLVLRELSHPNIIPLLGGGKTPSGTTFIVLEYLGGGTLRTRLDKCGGGLGIKPAVEYGRALASALAYMHDRALPGMIMMHRDLKPDNIGFTSTGVVKLMDFGLAKVIRRTLRSCSVKYSMTGETGSPRYMSPEVALTEPYNEKADVWSFTTILWEMVTGRLPFAGYNMAMYLERVCKGGERPVVVHSWPDDLKSVFASGWQTDPDKRSSFREIETILKDLHREQRPSKKKGFFGRG